MLEEVPIKPLLRDKVHVPVQMVAAALSLRRRGLRSEGVSVHGPGQSYFGIAEGAVLAEGEPGAPV